MDAPRWCRAARRRLGLSQRTFAELIGVSRAQIDAIERGQRVPRVDLLARLLAAADLDLMLCERMSQADREGLVAHLRLSLTQRLRVALDISPDLRVAARGPAWDELTALADVGQVVLEGPLANRLWLPVGPAAPVRVRVHQPRGRLPPLNTVAATVMTEPLPPVLVPVVLVPRRRVWVPPPVELAMDPVADQLRLADLLLHDQAPRDEAGRRRPPHRDPDEGAEAFRLEVTKGSEFIVIPDGTDGRGWRLDAPVSLAQYLGPDARLLT